MAGAAKNFDRMVRVDPDIYAAATVIARFEKLSIKDFVEVALREALDRRQASLLNTLSELKFTHRPIETSTQ